MTTDAGGSNAAHSLLQPDVAAVRLRRIEEEIDAIEAAQVALTRAKDRAGGRVDRKAYADYGATLDNIPDCLARLSEERAAILAEAGRRGRAMSETALAELRDMFRDGDPTDETKLDPEDGR